MSDLFGAVPVAGIRAISLWQPWATAIALGNKRIETRHWSTPYRGEIAIHAAKRFDADQREFSMVERALGRLPDRLPFGAIVAVASLIDVRRSEELKLSVSALERLYGNYEANRFGWLLQDIRPLSQPVGCAGRQSMWTLSAEVSAAVRAAL
jgi:hypothetical protein